MWNILILLCQSNIFTVKRNITFSVITLPTGKNINMKYKKNFVIPCNDKLKTGYTT